jgi:DNA-binding transcriptional LysR family regulator
LEVNDSEISGQSSVNDTDLFNRLKWAFVEGLIYLLFAMVELVVDIQLLAGDKLDLGFVRLARVPESLEMKMVHQDTFLVVLPTEHPLSEYEFKHIGQLKEENFILFSQDYSSIYYDKIMSVCEDKGFTPRITHKSVHALTIFKLVEAGLGVTIVPTSLKQGYDLKVKFIELDKIKKKKRSCMPFGKRGIGMLLWVRCWG